MLTCPTCGEVPKDDIRLYHDGLKKQNIGISPVLPTCARCGAEAAVTHRCTSGSLVILNGTCGSGKTSVAECLQSDGYLAIDGDCAIQALRHKKATKAYEWHELIDEIAAEIDILTFFNSNIVLSHVVLRGDVPSYLSMLASRGLRYKHVLLKPDYQTAVARCQTRRCHAEPTPEVWIKHFYDLLVFDEAQVHLIDNTRQTVAETAAAISALPWRNAAT